MSRFVARLDCRWPSLMIPDLVSTELENARADVSQLQIGLSIASETFVDSFPNSVDDIHLIFCTCTNQLRRIERTKNKLSAVIIDSIMCRLKIIYTV